MPPEGRNLRRSDPDDLEGRMLPWIEQLPLQRLQAPAKDVRLGGVQHFGQTVQALLLGGVQVDLGRLARGTGLAFAAFMIVFHEIMIVVQGAARHRRRAFHRGALRVCRTGEDLPGKGRIHPGRRVDFYLSERLRVRSSDLSPIP